MSAFSWSSKSSRNGSARMPKLLRRTSLKQWAGAMRRKLSTDKGGDAKNAQASTTEYVFEEGNDNCVTALNQDVCLNKRIATD